MNKVVKGVLGFFSWVWLVLSAVLMMLAAWKPKQTEALAGKFQTSVILYIAGAVLFLVAFFMLRTRLFSTRKRKEVHYANAIGEIAISLHAIEEALGRLLDENELVRGHEIQIYDSPNDKKLKITARLSMWEVTDLPSKVADLQQELKKRFEEIMPDAESVEYNVKLSSFIPRKERARREEEEPEAPEVRREGTDETDYFTGLKYPIEGDDEDEE